MAMPGDFDQFPADIAMGHYLRRIRQYRRRALRARLPCLNDLPREFARAAGYAFTHGAVRTQFGKPFFEESAETAEIERWPGVAKRFRHGANLFAQRRCFVAAI